MGQASRAPNLKDATGVEFSIHSMERLRERLPPGSHFLSMPDADIRRRVEECWQNAARAAQIEEWFQLNDNHQPEMIFVIDLKDIFETDVVGLFRENDRRAGVPVLVTVLTRDMAEKKKASNKWAKAIDKLGRRELLQSPMKQLAGLQLPARPAAVPVAAPPPAASLPVSPDDESMLVTWWAPKGNDKVHHSHRLPRRHRHQPRRDRALVEA